MANPANILVGCGGSGIRTLMRLNGLMAEDPYWRYRIDEDVYYVVLDTELDMIKQFIATVRRQLAGVKLPVIRPFKVAEGHSILQPVVTRHFIHPFRDGGKQRGRERLHEHWWTHKDYGPFTAPKVKPLTDGAGQCPAVSFFLTWYLLRKFEDEMDKLIEELKTRRGWRDEELGKDPSAQLNFCIIAGLAGGTGRGSWQLVAFKVRELLTAKYGIPSPVAYLFDSSVFTNIYRDSPRQEVPMKVNALTGISELSCWMENLRTAGKPVLRYQLPSMERPEDDQMDVLSVDLSLDTAASAPVDNAFLIFGGHRLAVLSDNLQYHDMVGTGLYAALSRSSIKSQRINERPVYQSLGTATFEVNAVTLRRYFEGLARIQALNALESHDDGRVTQAVEEFFKETHLRINISARNRAAFSADENGTLMQRACYHLLSTAEDDFGGLRSALEIDDPEEVEDEIRKLLEPNPQRVEEAVQKAIARLEVSPEKVAENKVTELFTDTQSVENVRIFIDKAKNRLRHELAQLPSPESMQLAREDDPLYQIQKLKGREVLGWVGRRFSENECTTIEQSAQGALLCANYEALRGEFEKRYKQWISLMDRWHDNAVMINETADSLEAKFEDELQDDVGAAGSNYEDFFNILFADFSHPEEAIPDVSSRGRFYRRELKPVLKRYNQAKKRGDAILLGKQKFSEELHIVLERTLLHGSLKPNAYDELDRLRRDLESAVRSTVHLPDRFIESHFSIRNVIKSLQPAWLQRFEKAKGREDELMRLIEKFETFFGVTPLFDGGRYVLPTGEEFVLQMASSLAASCRPYWRLRDAEYGENARVSLFLPIFEEQYSREEAEAYISKRLEAAKVTVEVYTEKGRPATAQPGVDRANPFILLGYSIAGTNDINEIASLDYWQTPTVKSLLADCEDPSGESVFDQTAEHNGVSYTDPLFVRNEEVRAVRWKPWVEKDVAKEVRDNEVRDTLLYALLEPMEGALKEKLDAQKWPLPLIRDKGQKWYEFTRRAMFWNNGDPREDTGCPWKARAPIGQSIWQVFNVFSGEGRQDGHLRHEGPKWADRIRQEARDFWDVVLLQLKIPKRSEPYEQLLKDARDKFDQLAQKSAEDDPDTPVWRGLLARVEEMLKT